MASEASSALIRGASLQPDNFFTECKYMLGRVFLPSQTPIRVEAYINSNDGGVGLIGTDQRMKYSSRLTTPDGKQIPLQERDFHIIFKGNLVEIPWVLRIVEYVLKKIFFFLQPKNQLEDLWVLPSKIFLEAKENDIVRFRWDGVLFEYRLKQLNHPKMERKTNFESFFQTLQVQMRDKADSKNPYLFEEDIPLHYSRRINKVFTEKAQFYSLKTKTLSPLTSDTLKQLKNHLSRAERFAITWYGHEDNSFTVVFDAPGVFEKNLSKKVSLLLDRRYLLILVQIKDEWAPQAIVIENSRPEYIFREIELPEDIDPSTINLAFRHGIGRMTYRLKASPQTASPTES